MKLNELSEHELAEAVREFNARYGEMERVLWCLSAHSRAALLDHDNEAPAVEALIWTIKSWWGVQGVRRETKSAMARALVTLEWTPELFGPVDMPPAGAEEYASTWSQRSSDKPLRWACSGASIPSPPGAPLAFAMAHPCLRQFRSVEPRYSRSPGSSRGLRPHSG